MGVSRLFKDEASGSETTVIKYIYLKDVVSYEEGTAGIFDFTGPTIYILTEFESFYIVGDIKEFKKEMDKFIADMRKLMLGNASDNV